MAIYEFLAVIRQIIPALQTNKTVSPRAETPSRQFAQVFAQICSRAAEHATLAGNIFRWHRMAAVIADTNRESY